MGYLASSLNLDLADDDILRWLLQNQIKTESGREFELNDHYFLIDSICDWSPHQVDLKAPQIGYTIAKMLKAYYAAAELGLAVGYTFPTREFASELVAEKADRLIDNNPVIKAKVGKKNDVFQKDLGKAFVAFRGTMGEREAIASTLDILMHDELDQSNQKIIETYESRLQFSKYKARWLWSNPTVPNNGVAPFWELSDQLHWFVKCHTCGHESYLDWFAGETKGKKNHTIDREARQYICGECRAELSDDDRRYGRWIAKYPDRYQGGRGWRGRWYSLLMCSWVSASEIVDKWRDKPEDYFYTMVLGLSYVGGGATISYDEIMDNVVEEEPDTSERVVIGLDTGLPNWAVLGTDKGIFKYEAVNGYDEVRIWLKQYPNSILVADAGGDLVGSRELRDDFPGRVFLCHFGADRKTMALVRWGEGEEFGNVIVDRNRMIQVVVDELRGGKLPLFGTEPYWNDYVNHYLNIYRVEKENAQHIMVRSWERKGPDHLVMSTVYYRAGVERFGGMSEITKPKSKRKPPLFDDSQAGVTRVNPEALILKKPKDWRRMGG